MQCQIKYKSFANYLLNIILWMCIYFTVCNAILNNKTRVENTGSLCNNLDLCKCGYNSIKCECRNDKQYIEISSTNLNQDISIITISNCHSVRFSSNSIKARLNLRIINIKNVYDLQLPQSSLEWDGYDMTPLRESPRIEISITDSMTANIGGYSFKGNIKSIKFHNFRIKKIDPFAFSSIKYCDSIIFKNSIIEKVQIQGFKQFTTDELIFENTTFEGVLISRAFSDITVHSHLRISSKSKFDTLKPNAMIVSSPRQFDILDSSFKHLESEAFKIVTSGDIKIRNNIFEEIDPFAFAKISFSSKNIKRADAVFGDNTLNKISNNSLYFNISSFDVKMFNVNISQTCACENLETWLNICNATKANQIKCQYQMPKTTIPTSLSDYQTKHCSAKLKTFKTIAIILSILSVIAILLMGIFFYYCRRRKKLNKTKKTWINNASPIMNRHREIEAPNGNLPLIVPDGRTYKETELHVIVERAEPLTTEL